MRGFQATLTFLFKWRATALNVCVHHPLIPLESFYGCSVSFGIIQDTSAQEGPFLPTCFPIVWKWGSPSEHSFYLYSSQKFLLFEAGYLISVTSWHFSSVYLFSVYGTFLTKFNQNKQRPEREIPVYCECQQHWRNSCSDPGQTHSKIIISFISRQERASGVRDREGIISSLVCCGIVGTRGRLIPAGAVAKPVPWKCWKLCCWFTWMQPCLLIDYCYFYHLRKFLQQNLPSNREGSG